MHRVYLFGIKDIHNVPSIVTKHLEQILVETNREAEFIVGDKPGIDAGFHYTLSSIGAASKTKIYCLDYSRSNSYGLPLKIFKTAYDQESKEVVIYDDTENVKLHLKNIITPENLKTNRQYYEFIDQQMIEDCTFAVCLWDGKERRTFTQINLLKARDKYVYVYNVA